MWDYDKFARREGFRDGKHRNDWYAGREQDGCLIMLAICLFGLMIALARENASPNMK